MTTTNQKIYLTTLFIIGMMYALFFSAFGSAMDVMYDSETEGTNFLSFFRGVVALMAFAGIFVSLQSIRSRIATTAIVLLLLGAFVSVLTGHVFSYETRTDEYLLYFVSTTAATVLFVLAFTILSKFLFAQAGKELIKFLIVGAAGAAMGYLVNFSFTLTETPTITLWYVIGFLLLVLTFFLQKEKTATAPPR